jgi:hypothetical protein
LLREGIGEREAADKKKTHYQYAHLAS